MKKMKMEQKPQTIDVEYYQWLVSQIKIGNPNKTCNEMFEIMHNTEFVWFIPNDGNRVGDGKYLRENYFRFELDSVYEEGDLVIEFVSFLEVLVGLSVRFAWVMSDQGNEPYWAWRLVKNIDLHKMFDPLTNKKVEKINEVLYNVIWRTYDRSGHGGFFPLDRTTDDQTKKEIWYQMQEYSMEKDPIY
jgi:hypothetical protein